MRECFPTIQHSEAAHEIIAFFRMRTGVQSVLVVNSCARGKATPDSCLDIAVLLTPQDFAGEASNMELAWQEHYGTMPVFTRLKSVGLHSVVHLYFTSGEFVAKERDEVSEPDSFELEIGNCLVYSVPIWSSSHYFEELRKRWLPYYDEALRRERLATAVSHCLNDLDHIPWYIRRGLHFQAFERLHLAFKGFLQALFIGKRRYPIAYNKWIHEQIVDILNMPELYRELPRLFELRHFESDEMSRKADRLKLLVHDYITAPATETTRKGG